MKLKIYKKKKNWVKKNNVKFRKRFWIINWWYVILKGKNDLNLGKLETY